jgi:hypothetical protein
MFMKDSRIIVGPLRGCGLNSRIILGSVEGVSTLQHAGRFLEWHGAPDCCSAPPSDGPDFSSESGSPFRRCGVDQRNGVGYVHGAARIALDAHNGVHPLAEGFGSSGWIVLLRASPESRAFERVRATDVTRPARPYEVFGRAVLLVSVNVSDFDIALPSA